MRAQLFRSLLMLACILALTAGPSLAAEPKDDTPTARVLGQGSVWAKPDMAQLLFTIETEASKVPEAADANAKQADAFLAALKKLLGQDEVVQSLSYRVDPVYAAPEKGKRPKVTGYRARHSFRVRLKDIKKVGEVIDAGLSHGATQVSGPHWEHSKLDELKRQAAVQGLAQARQMAEALAASQNMKLKGLRQVSTHPHGPPFPRPMMMAAGRAEMEAAPTPIEVGEEEIRAQVEAVFELQ